MELYPDVIEILEDLQEAGIPVAAASRTESPEDARKLLRVLDIDRLSIFSIPVLPDILNSPRYFKAILMNTGSKVWHMQEAAKRCGVGNVRRVVLFDDETRNIIDVSKIGCCAVEVPSRNGLTLSVFRSGISQFLNKQY